MPGGPPDSLMKFLGRVFWTDGRISLMPSAFQDTARSKFMTLCSPDSHHREPDSHCLAFRMVLYNEYLYPFVGQ